MRTRVLAALLVLAVHASGAEAQVVCEESCRVQAGQPFVALTDAVMGTGPRLYVDGAVLSVPVATVNGLHEFYIPGAVLAPGAHRLEIRTVNAAMTEPFVLTVEPPAPPPDVCASDPLVFTVARWPSATTGRRSVDYRVNRPVSLHLEQRINPWTVTATDARGCTVVLTR
jgi:hypothetical protein